MFTVWLPAVAAAAVEEPSADDAPFSGQGRRVLYVDDEPAIRVLAAMLLERLGCEAVTADSADGAERLLVRPGMIPDAVVTDLHMPGADGLELVRRLRAKVPTVPIVVATGLADDGLRSAVRGLGRIQVLDKPYTQRALGEALAVAFGEDRRQQTPIPTTDAD
jgi:CheY-like chemotaxis protein